MATICSPTLRHLRWHIVSRAGLLLSSYGVFRAFEHQRRLCATQVQLAELYGRVNTSAVVEAHNVDEAPLLDFINATAAPGDLLDILDIAGLKLGGAVLAAVLERLAELSRRVASLREIVAAHPAVEEIYERATSSCFDSPESAARFARACVRLGLPVADWHGITSLVVKSPRPEPLAALADAMRMSALPAATVRLLLMHLSDLRLREFALEELLVLAGACADLAADDCVVGIGRELRRRLAGPIAGAGLLHVLGHWLADKSGARQARLALLHHITALLEPPAAVARLPTPLLIEFVRSFGAVAYVSPRVLVPALDTLQTRLVPSTVLPLEALGTLGIFTPKPHAPQMHIAANAYARRRARALATVAVHDMERCPSKLAVPDQLVAVAALLVAARCWSSHLWDWVERQTLCTSESLDSEGLATLGSALVAGHMDGGRPLARAALREVRYKACAPGRAAKSSDIMRLAKSLNRAHVVSLDKKLAWGGVQAGREKQPILSPTIARPSCDSARLRGNAVLPRRD